MKKENAHTICAGDLLTVIASSTAKLWSHLRNDDPELKILGSLQYGDFAIAIGCAEDARISSSYEKVFYVPVLTSKGIGWIRKLWIAKVDGAC